MASAELQTVINLIRSRPVPETPPTFQERRAGMESTAAPVPEDVKVERVDAGGVPADWVSAPGADDSKVVLYLHGGGYVIGSAITHRELASRISRTSGARVLVVDYRLAPEHPFPAAVDDAVAAYRWMLGQGVAPASAAVDAARAPRCWRPSPGDCGVHFAVGGLGDGRRIDDVAGGAGPYGAEAGTH